MDQAFKVTPEELHKAANLLKHVRTSQEVKLRYGAMKRLELKDRLKRGESADDYRGQWLKESRDELIHALGEIARKFNTKYPHDCCSVADLGDIAISLVHYIKKVQES